LGYILGIYKNLHILLPQNPAQWIRNPNSNPIFGGKPALNRMMAGNVADLFVVRQYLDAWRGGWARFGIGQDGGRMDDQAFLLDILSLAEARLSAAAKIMGVPPGILMDVLDQLVRHPELGEYMLSQPVRDYLGLPSPAGPGWKSWPPVPIFVLNEKTTTTPDGDSARLRAKAIDVLGTPEKADSWLQAPNRALGGATPISLIGTGAGAQEAINVLGRIEYGVFS
jgi:hypothetical protein